MRLGTVYYFLEVAASPATLNPTTPPSLSTNSSINTQLFLSISRGSS
jgi:hypothetical protein